MVIERIFFILHVTSYYYVNNFNNYFVHAPIKNLNKDLLLFMSTYLINRIMELL